MRALNLPNIANQPLFTEIRCSNRRISSLPMLCVFILTSFWLMFDRNSAFSHSFTVIYISSWFVHKTFFVEHRSQIKTRFNIIFLIKHANIQSKNINQSPKYWLFWRDFLLDKYIFQIESSYSACRQYRQFSFYNNFKFNENSSRNEFFENLTKSFSNDATTQQNKWNERYNRYYSIRTWSTATDCKFRFQH